MTRDERSKLIVQALRLFDELLIHDVSPAVCEAAARLHQQIKQHPVTCACGKPSDPHRDTCDACHVDSLGG